MPFNFRINKKLKYEGQYLANIILGRARICLINFLRIIFTVQILISIKSNINMLS
ncbi:hypothetical protein ASZ90_006155 [hydrocarbon metagenome]|uniref:Uncharacterized protein n=1 Tax=hydrocarbon metagenome TaxID=938273 RepID=A0A0W8FT17_9ZZZZ